MELMAVVTITGILSTLGYVSLSRHASAAKSIEALTMVQNIRVAQERWRSSHMMYLNVSAATAWYPRDPTIVANRNTLSSFFLVSGASHNDNVNWLALRPAVTGPVQFGYLTKAGNSATGMPAPISPGFSSFEWPKVADITENWYTIEAFGDTDWDGTMSSYLASSLTGAVARFRDGE